MKELKIILIINKNLVIRENNIPNRSSQTILEILIQRNLLKQVCRQIMIHNLEKLIIIEACLIFKINFIAIVEKKFLTVKIFKIKVWKNPVQWKIWKTEVIAQVANSL